MANTPPTRFEGAAAADKAENCGESATTAAPQTRRMARNVLVESSLPTGAGVARHRLPRGFDAFHDRSQRSGWLTLRSIYGVARRASRLATHVLARGICLEREGAAAPAPLLPSLMEPGKE